MATSPHQPKSLSDRITELKEELESKKALRGQIEALGQTTSGAGMSTTFVGYADLCERISWLEAKIEALVAQLNRLRIGWADFVKPVERHGERRIARHFEILSRECDGWNGAQPCDDLIGTRAFDAVARGLDRKVAFEKPRQHPVERQRR